MITLDAKPLFTAMVQDPAQRLAADRRFRAWLAGTGAIVGEGAFMMGSDGRITIDTMTDLSTSWAAFNPAALSPDETDNAADRTQFEIVKNAILDGTATAAQVRTAVRWLVKRELARGGS